MKQTLDTGHVVEFGQPLEELERLFGSMLQPLTSRAFRHGIDKRFKFDDFILEFDSNRLRAIEFLYPYKFVNPVMPYVDSWKNFVTLDKCKMNGGMLRHEFVMYLDAWKERAHVLAISPVEFGEMSAGQYAISNERNRFRDMIHVSMGPTRKSGAGGLWCDSWTAFFSMTPSSLSSPGEGTLTSLTVFADQFNTVAR